MFKEYTDCEGHPAVPEWVYSKFPNRSGLFLDVRRALLMAAKPSQHPGPEHLWCHGRSAAVCGSGNFPECDVCWIFGGNQLGMVWKNVDIAFP
jgi:hypothetical protein